MAPAALREERAGRGSPLRRSSHDVEQLGMNLVSQAHARGLARQHERCEYDASALSIRASGESGEAFTAIHPFLDQDIFYGRRYDKSFPIT